MLLREKVHNVIIDLKMNFIKYAYIYTPMIGLSLFFLLNKIIEFNFTQSYQSNVINISGILAGFLFTSLGIIVSLPDNKFTNLLKQTGYMKIIYTAMFIGIITLLIGLLIGLFNLNRRLLNIFFIIGISETFISAYYLYKVSYYTNKSN